MDSWGQFFSAAPACVNRLTETWATHDSANPDPQSPHIQEQYAIEILICK
jgi:hypothetical protein